MNSLFEAVELAPRDPILGLNEQFNADTRSTKVNLGVGVYSDDQGRIPLLESVHKAELARVNAAAARGYLPIDGIASYNKGAQVLRSEEHTSELQSLMRISYAVFCLKKKKKTQNHKYNKLK